MDIKSENDKQIIESAKLIFDAITDGEGKKFINEFVQKDPDAKDYIDYTKELLVLIQNDPNYYHSMIACVAAIAKVNMHEYIRLVTLMISISKRQ